VDGVFPGVHHLADFNVDEDNELYNIQFKVKLATIGLDIMAILNKAWVESSCDGVIITRTTGDDNDRPNIEL
jgi:hypothetical protein